MRWWLLLTVLLLAPFALALPVGAQAVPPVNLRLDSALKYPNDRPIHVEVQAQAFEGDRPLQDDLVVTINIRPVEGNNTIPSRTLTVAGGKRTTVILSEINETGPYWLRATAQHGYDVSLPIEQLTWVYPPPIVYHAEFMDATEFAMVVEDNHTITVTEWLETPTSKTTGRVLTTNDSLKIDVPIGQETVCYDIEDEHGWHNYHRAPTTGESTDGDAYCWDFRDPRRTQPYANWFGWAGFVITGIVVLSFLGVAVYYATWGLRR